MKKLISLLLIVAFSSAYAQSPQGFNYQAVARDAAGVAITNQSIGVQLLIIQGTPSGASVYTETHTVTSNNIGLLNLVVGNGSVVAGTFSAINWANGPYFIEISIDVTGGTNYVLMGTQQLMSVPYALYALNAGTSGPQGATGATGLQGATGNDGAQGATGNDGAQGATGNNGVDGATGATGADGLVGPTGTNGVDGATGATGADGLVGPTGTNGATGSTGATGAAGVAGTNGTNGATGSTGATGAAGVAGTNGATGSTGATGAAGVAGTNGTNGTTGATGATGAAGVAGTNGTNGTAGATGATGTAGTNGTNGATGSTGATGLAGATGPQGAQGVQGPQGVTGATGTFGVVGTTGQTIYHNGTAWVATSNLFNDGTNIGIGVLNPSSKLQVKNTANTTDANAGLFEISNPSSPYDAVIGGTNGSGMAVSGYNSGSGRAAAFQVTEAANVSEVIYANTYGTGPVASFEISNTSSSNSALYTKTLGTGNAAHVDGKLKVTDGTEGAGKVLTSDASGNATWHKSAFSKVTGSTAIAFTNTGVWTNFPDLSTTITVTNNADVLVSYNTSNSGICGGTFYFTTRVLVDGVDAKELRNIGSIDGENYFSCSASSVISLTSGTHTITVQYRTNVCSNMLNNDPTTDYMTRSLTVKELK